MVKMSKAMCTFCCTVEGQQLLTKLVVVEVAVRFVTAKRSCSLGTGVKTGNELWLTDQVEWVAIFKPSLAITFESDNCVCM